jgi:hypothetical protein
MTLGQLETMAREWIREELANDERLMNALQNNGGLGRNYVYGLRGLARLLGCSKTKACALNTSGLLTPAVSRIGNLMIYDADMVMTLLKEASDDAATLQEPHKLTR